MATMIFHPRLYEEGRLKNIYLGSMEVIIRKESEGVYIVKREDYAYKEVYRGSYEDCVDYVQQLFIDYQEGILL